MTLKLEKELKLVDLYDIETVKVLQKMMDTKTLKAFNTGWSIETVNGRQYIKRKSIYDDDYIVSQWFHDNNFEGFIGYGIKGLHDECCISEDKSKSDEIIRGFGEKFPLKILNSYPTKYLIPACQEPFNKINYIIQMN